MQVGGVQALGTDDGHGRIGQRLQAGRDDVARRRPLRLDHDHDLTLRAPQARLQRIASAERDGRADDLVCWAVDRDVGPGDDDHLRPLRHGGRERSQRRVGAGPLGRQDDDRSRSGGRFLQPGRYRRHGAVARLTVGGDIGRLGRLQVVAGAEVDDLPAGGLDASLELIRGPIVALDPRCCALVGERDDVVGY